MERYKHSNMRNLDDWQSWPDSDAAERYATEHREKHETKISKDVSGNDMTEENRDRLRHHQAFGNRTYKSYSNHSSADDQPRTDTGT